MTYTNNKGRVIIEYDDDEVSDINPLPILSTADELAKYMGQDVEEGTSITYAGKQKNTGEWLIIKIDETSDTEIRYANVSNNSSYTTYTTAYAARASLNYATIDNLIGL